MRIYWRFVSLSLIAVWGCLIWISHTEATESETFNHDHFGVSFFPRYFFCRKNRTDNELLKNQLDLVHTRFSNIYLDLIYEHRSTKVLQFSSDVEQILHLLTDKNKYRTINPYRAFLRFKIVLDQNILLEFLNKARQLYQKYIEIRDIIWGIEIGLQSHANMESTELLTRFLRLKAVFNRSRLFASFDMHDCINSTSLPKALVYVGQHVDGFLIYDGLKEANSIYNTDTALTLANRYINNTRDCQKKLKSLAPNLSVGLVTVYAKRLRKLDFSQFWYRLRDWAIESNTTVFIHEAFDVPQAGKEEQPKYRWGWWQVKDNNKDCENWDPKNINYTEEISIEAPEHTTTSKNSPEITASVNSPEITTSINSPEITTSINSPEITTSINSPEITTSINSPEITTSINSPEITTSINSLEIVKYAYSPETQLGFFITGIVIVLIGVAMLAFVSWKPCFPRQHYIALNPKEIKEFLKGHEAGLSHGIVSDNDSTSGTDCIYLPYENRKYELGDNDFLIQESCVIGSGAFGKVCLSEIKQSGKLTTVAVKMTKSRCSLSAQRSLLAEIKILSYLGNHGNILQLYGAYTKDLRKGKILVFTELCALGSLENVLRQMQKCNFPDDMEPYIGQSFQPELSSSQAFSATTFSNSLNDDYKADLRVLVQWCYELALGMEYISSKKVVHADLAARNVLLTAQRTIKIADFGLSKKLYNMPEYIRKQSEYLPWKWMAPEALSCFVLNERTDVWSYGVTIWEIFSLGQAPYPGVTWSPEWVNKLEQGLKLSPPRLNHNNVHQLMLKCWSVNPALRPGFISIKSELENTFNCWLASEEETKPDGYMDFLTSPDANVEDDEIPS